MSRLGRLAPAVLGLDGHEARSDSHVVPARRAEEARSTEWETDRPMDDGNDAEERASRNDGGRRRDSAESKLFASGELDCDEKRSKQPHLTLKSTYKLIIYKL
jgi:hypothetical protein